MNLPNNTYQTSPAIPSTPELRNNFRELAAQYTQINQLTGPVTLDQLKHHCQTIISQHHLPAQYQDFLAICLNNQIWHDAVAAVPYNQRLLLLPKCLRHSTRCPADFDQYGLKCQNCGLCPLGPLTDQARQLGYTILIAEGSPIVMSLITSGQIHALIGVSCLAVLEQTFPFIEAAALPALALPLLYDGCTDTTLDLPWLEEVLTNYQNTKQPTLTLNDLKNTLKQLFTKETLQPLFPDPQSATTQIALDSLTHEGKRWRPLLTAAIYNALAPNPQKLLPPALRDIALAVECFHKASLIHDDIEDNDDYRYNQPTLHKNHGTDIALNIGDYLIGQGYHLIAQADLSDHQKIKMLQAAAHAHTQLTLGQGRELSWLKNPSPLTVPEIIEIFAQKTAPAFEVALKLGLYLNPDHPPFDKLIENFSRQLGIAYQICDDLADFDTAANTRQPLKLKPSLIYALACQNASPTQKKLLESAWPQTKLDPADTNKLLETFNQLNVKKQALTLLNSHKQDALKIIAPLNHPQLKPLLRIIITRIFHEMEYLSCCHDFTNRHD